MKKMSGTIGAVIMFAAMLFSFAAYANSSDIDKNIAAVDAYKAKVMRNIGQGKKIYFAGPMFNHAEKEFNLRITKVLEEYGYKVFLPQRDGIEGALLKDKPEEELTRMIFALDDTQVRKADIVFMNIDGRTPDEGASVELGIAYGIGKRCYGFKTDTRSVEYGLEINPMISGCMIKIFKNYDGDKLVEEIKQYLSKNAL
jgi:nucleoside 2-deoxyribosyltransferase